MCISSKYRNICRKTSPQLEKKLPRFTTVPLMQHNCFTVPQLPVNQGNCRYVLNLNPYYFQKNVKETVVT